MDREALGFEEAARACLKSACPPAFLQTASEATLVRFESDIVFVQLYHGRSSYEVGLELGRKNVSADLHRPFGIADILALADVEASEEYRNPMASNERAVRTAIQSVCEVLKSVAAEAFSGEQAFYTGLAAAQNHRLRAGVDALLARQAERALQAAWSRKDFRETVRILEDFPRELSPSERQKLDYARQQRGPSEMRPD